ncbi:hypothetical protein J4212_03755 [Candidatus Woesearchaeota archaeon]|nr:hypothetical protein [Candidatus Woesearchaeota archaeon]
MIVNIGIEKLLLQLLSIAGFLISLYFAFVYHGLARASEKLIPANVCSAKTCHSVLETKFAKAFKIPNFYLGLVYYYIVFVSTFYNPEGMILWGFLIVSWLAVLFSAYLFYALVFKLKTRCNLCFAAQMINLGIGMMLVLGFYG